MRIGEQSMPNNGNGWAMEEDEKVKQYWTKCGQHTLNKVSYDLIE
jgi:hypothetical protein